MNRPARSHATVRPGVHLTGDGALFTIFSRRATRAWLMIFEQPDDAAPAREIALEPVGHRIGDFWHIFVPDIRPGQAYAWRMDGPRPDFDPSQWLLDPYAEAVATPRRWGENRGLVPGRWPRDGAAFPKALIVADEYDWGDDRPPATPLADTILYEAHLRGFTAHPSSRVAAPGTWSGFRERIPHLVELGVTAVEFLPLHEFDEMEFLLENRRRRDLRNLWGYSPLAFLAANARYAADPRPGASRDEFRDLVRALHRAGIEVVLDVVFNHTAELDDAGPVYSFKGLDRSVYYLLDPGGRLLNFSGCGNSLNANHPVVQELILDTLRHWAIEFHVDGFRFDLGSALTRGADGRPMERPPVIERIAEDPALRQVKLIAEAWDAGGLYQVGSFPHARWSEWNGIYRDEVRRFWGGTSGLLGRLATRIAGSSDLYERDGQTPLKSVNFVTCHDGFTLADLVRYSTPRNEANGEDGRDGERQNFSFNCGVEGPSDDPAVEALRLRQQKNLLATLLVSQGVPMLLAGDEFGRTQRGNNNAYAQDNDVSWVDWTLVERNAELLAFARLLIRFRREHRSLRRTAFLTGLARDGAPADIEWFGTDGNPPPWETGSAVAFRLSGDRRCFGGKTDEEDVLIAVNGGAHAVRFVLPAPPSAPWRLAWSTEPSAPKLEVSGPAVLLAGPLSVTALVAPRSTAAHGR